MSKLDILNQNWIDIVFAGRNKEYGAYQLRKDNVKNTNKALIIGGLAFILAVSSPLIIKYLSGFVPETEEKLKETEVILASPPPVDEKKVPPPPPVEPPPPKVDQVKFPPPVVKPDEEVVEEEPPTIKELEKADPGEKTIKGDPKKGLMVIIKPTDKSNYKNFVDILDEIKIADVPSYGIVNKIENAEIGLMKDQKAFEDQQ